MTRSDADQPSGPKSLRRAAQGDDVRIVSQAVPYKDFFAVQETHLTHQRFDGTQSAVIKRAAFVSGDAVTVLPVDPIRKRVLLVEQFRMGPFARGDRQPWSLEAIAGRMDAGESPERLRAAKPWKRQGSPWGQCV